jgi:hypothetical protein
MIPTLHNSDAYAQFIEFFVRGVPANRFYMLPQSPALGLQCRDIAGWARTFVDSKETYGLDFHKDPCTYLGFADKAETYYNLVMGYGDGYAVDLRQFDALGDDIRKEVANNVICGVSDCGCVPWLSSLREKISHYDAGRMIFWKQGGASARA